MLDGGLARRHRLIRVFVLQLREVEADPVGDLQRPLQGARPAGEQARHLGGRLEMPLGVGFQPKTRLLDRTALADAGEHVLQGPPFGRVVEDIVGGDHRRAGALAERVQPRQAVQVPRAVGPGGGEPDAAPEFAGQGPQGGFESLA